jgi:hypothetical protein
LELLALGRERVFQWGSQAVAGCVALDHYAVAVLEAESQRGAWACLVSTEYMRHNSSCVSYGCLYMTAASWLYLTWATGAYQLERWWSTRQRKCHA